MTWLVTDDIANMQLDIIETVWGASPLLKIFDADHPSTAGAADIGNVLISMTLPADAMGSAVARSKAFNGPWSTNAALLTGLAKSFAIYTSGGVVKSRGKVRKAADADAGTAQMIMNDTNVVAGVAQQVTQFTLARP